MFDRQTSFLTTGVASAAQDTIAHAVKHRHTAISLYSGAGGLDLGFSRAGFEALWAVDNDRWAVQTYNQNLANTAVCADVLEVDPPSGLSPDVIIGGPPCQGFSVIGRMNPKDPRSQHVNHFFDVVEHLLPKAFVMENVKALGAAPRWSQIREQLLSRARDLGFETSLWLLNAQDYGVPQSRERMFLVGVRDIPAERPTPTSKESPRTVRQALSTLPSFGALGNEQRCTAKVIPAQRPIMRPSPYKGSLLFNGSGRVLDLDAPAKTLPASMGGNATPILDQLELEIGADPWVVDYHRRLLASGKPARIAPPRMRRITVEEAAVLQTFPPGWQFCGPRVAQYRQIGNAVPPVLAEAVARRVAAALDQLREGLSEPASRAA
jgi:DNA (cytosine-5)-methyltransferase 1